MSFMESEIVQGEFLNVETDCGSELIPDLLINPDDFPEFCDDEDPRFADLVESIRDYVEGSEVYSIERVTGFFARYSAPGYLDCTEWQGPFDSENEAARELSELYGED